MSTDTQTSRKISRGWQWLIIFFVIFLSFACVFLSAESASGSEPDRVIQANLLADSKANYMDFDEQVEFAPMDSKVILEVTRDADGLKKTLIVPSLSTTPVSVAKLPDTLTPQPTVANTRVLPSATNPQTATQVPASNTPIPPTATQVPDTPTPIQATSTATFIYVAPSATATQTRKPKQPTATSVPPSATLTSTDEPTFTPTLTWTPTETPVPPPTNTPTILPSDTPIIPPTDTPVNPPTNTPIIPPTDTPITPPIDTPVGPPTDTPIPPPPTITPIPPYQNIRPLLRCVENNGDGTFKAYFGYNNRNNYSVSLSVGSNNMFFPAPADRGQPETFSPGRRASAFSVNFNEDAGLLWVLDGGAEVAWRGSPLCP